jgi:putative ABC transport system permease protein
MKTGSQRSISGFWARMRSLIIAGEVALTLVLLVSAGLLLRSLYKLAEVNTGFDASHVLTVQISPDQSSCKERATCVALYDRLLERSSSIPGVTAAAISNSVPLDGQVPTIPVDIEGQQKTTDHPAPMLWLGAVSPEYLSLMRVPLLAGRYLTRADGPKSAGVVVISASTAKHFWPAGSAIGKHIKPTGSREWRTVVGVVGDAHYFTLSSSLPAWVPGLIYMPYSQSEKEDGQIPAAMTLVVKVAPDDARVRAGIRELAAAEDPAAPIGRVESLEDTASGSIADFRSMMQVFLSFASAAIILAAVGIYGLMSYWVSQRTYEIGLRVAIGATRTRIVSMVLAQGLRVSIYGAIAGIVTAGLLTRFLASMLYGVGETDTLTFAIVTSIVLGVAVLATAYPAWRAARIDPIKSLRAE